MWGTNPVSERIKVLRFVSAVLCWAEGAGQFSGCAWAVSWPLVPRIFQVPVPPHPDASIKKLALEKKG